jgi:hypothetical protein
MIMLSMHGLILAQNIFRGVKCSSQYSRTKSYIVRRLQVFPTTFVRIGIYLPITVAARS